MKVFGIDIIHGSVRSRGERPRFALVIRDDGEERETTEVSVFRLLRLIAREEPDILAVDSVQEIARDQKALFSFLQSLPPRTMLVQSTGGEKQESLPRVAARYNLKFNRFDPFAEARASAVVAELGGGAEVVAFENTTDVTVSRGRSLGKGGWSQNRYARKVHGAVRQTAREVEETLREQGLSYITEEVKAFGGLGRVHFVVSSPREDVPVRNVRSADVQVKVAGRRLDRIRYRTRGGGQRYLFVGIDPGTTVGIAAVTLDGEPVLVKSSRTMAMPDVIEALYTAGRPLVVATDVHPMPASVERIRRAFSAVAYTPKADRTVEEKKALCGDIPYGNDHERDSLSAAMDAFRAYQPKFRNVTKRVPAGHDMDEVRAGVVRGLSLEQILGKKVPSPVEEEEGEEVPAPGPRDDRLLQLDGMVKSLRGHVADLQAEGEAKDLEIARLNALMERERGKESRSLRKDAEVAKLDTIIANQKKKLRREERRTKKLRKQVDRLRRLATSQTGDDRLLVKATESLSRDAIRQVDADFGIAEGDIITVKTTAGWGTTVLDTLAEMRIRALVGDGDERLKDACLERGIVLLHPKAIGLEVRGPVGSADASRFAAAEEAWQKEIARYEQGKKSEMIESIFREYRTEREREVKRDG
ncbi:DUF460 domain-containing protein [Methanogenium organophilum]|uniref:DUF460 domain-containing protein n=1 Tax=Methanogenium organophilum TaxID=2199 RepID=A0A9X9S573_METOG|nr:DUF460 domain-containing protein [Methanogenium organophilum]WAI02134.1 DUF460 domain-containing protein [Methanogenium organophilum]